MKRLFRITALINIVLSAFFLAGCGQFGPLYLPSPETKAEAKTEVAAEDETTESA